MDPFDHHEDNATDDDRAIPNTTHLLPGQRPPSDPIEGFPRQPGPEER